MVVYLVVSFWSLWSIGHYLHGVVGREILLHILFYFSVDMCMCASSSFFSISERCWGDEVRLISNFRMGRINCREHGMKLL